MKLKLIHGDCLEEMKRLPDRSIDMFLCDLPYGCLASGYRATGENPNNDGESRNPPSNCSWDIKIDLEAFWIQVERLMKDDHTPIIHFCSTKFGNDLINSKPKWFRYDLVWNKMRGVGFLSANKMPMRSHELIYVFAKKGARYNRIDVEGVFQPYSFKGTPPASQYSQDTNRTATHNDGKTRCVLSVIDVSNHTLRKSSHPTQKPDDLYAWLIARYSKEGDTILDPTAGSFASCFTANTMNRQAIGIEMDDKFYNKANSRAKE